MNTKASPVEQATKCELRTDAQLWIGMIGGPVLWLIQFQTIYTVAGWGCALHSKFPLYLASGFFFLLVVVSGLLAARHLNQAGAGPVAKRTRFMALVGIMSSALSLLVITSQGIATIMLSPCLQ
jgi:hypothetical protein